MGLRGWRDLAPAFGLGVLAASGQAPLGAWYLAVPAFAGIVWQVTAGRPAARGWAAGTGYFAAALSWIVQPFFVEPETYG